MAWETRGQRRYYYRGRREQGRVIKVYVGGGAAGEQAAREDEQRQIARAVQRGIAELERASAKPAHDLMIELDSQVTIAIRSALTKSGYHQHARGRWRRKRHGKTSQTESR